MGSSVERFLRETGGTQAPSRRSSVDQFLDETGGDPKRLSLATQHAVPPERAARILELQRVTALTPDFIDRNFDEVDKRARAVDHDPERFKAQAPTLFAQLAENHYYAGLLGDDLGPLSRAESLLGRLKAGFRAGRAEGRVGRIGAERRDANYARFTPGIDDATRREIDRLEEIIAATPAGRTFLDRATTSASKIVGQMSESLAYAGAVGLGGASTGAAIGAAGGPVTAGAGAALGFTGGFLGGLAYDAFRVEGGHQYVTLSEDPTIDEGTRQSVSYGVGLVNAALETGGAAAVGAAYKPLVRRFFRQSVADALARPTMRGAVVDFGKAYATALAGETGTEVAQEITSMVGEEIARMGEGGELDDLITDPEKREEAMRRLAQIAQETAEGMSLLALPGAGVRFTSSAYEARKATQRERYFTALGETMAESKALKRLPSAVQDMVARQTKDGPIENFYAPVEEVITYFQSKQLDAAAVADELGIRPQFDEAVRTGSDLVIPTPVYATRIAPTEHNAFFAKELRTRPNEMNARQAQEYLDQIAKEQQATATAPSEEAAVDEGRQVEDEVTGMLVQAEYDESTARANAQQYAAFIRTMAARAGMTPLALHRKHGVTIERIEPPRAHGAGPAINLADVANRALVFRETQTERQGLAAEEAGETYGPYAVQREKRDAVARSEAGEFLYARTANGVLRGNLKSITTDGLIEELAFIYEQLAEDQGLIRQTVAPDENFHTFEDGRDHISFKGQAVKAIGRMQSRQKAIARLEAELHRRGVTDAGDRLNRQILGEDTTFDPNTFQQSPLRHGQTPPPLVQETDTDIAFAVRRRKQREALGSRSALTRYMTLLDISEDATYPAERREEAARQAADIEQDARAEYDKRFEDANAKLADAPNAILYHQRGRLSFEEFVALRQALPGGDAPRGQIKFKVGEKGEVSIELLADANLSTFLHETGHFYLEVLRDIATSPDAAPDIVRDLDIIKRWVGWQDGQTTFTREQHEQWARGIEGYFLEGKAPSTELRSAFTKFRAWLLDVYRDLRDRTSLTALLSDEVRGVMDRMLATDDEITAAEREQQMQPLFPDPAAFGMSEQQAANYRATIEAHRETAVQEVQGKLIAQIQREQDAIYQAERRRVRAEVAEEVNQERDSAALAFLSRGTLPDGSPLPADLEAVKLSKASLAEYEGRHSNLLPLLRAKGFLYAKEGGVHPDQVAEWFGYASGDELLQALLAYEGTPKQRIERLTDERMRAEDPNLVSPGELAEEAIKATHNEQRAQVLYLEMQHLVSQDFATFKGLVRRLARRLPPVSEVRGQAERIVRHKKIRDIAPVLYQRAEAKAARASLDAGLKGDWETAFDEKMKELLNHELYRAAVAARETVEKTAEFMARFGKTDVRAEIGKAGGDYLEQIDALLDRFDFRKSITNRAIDRRGSLRKWYEAQVAAGEQPLVPEKLLDEAYRTHYKEMTPDELTGLRNTVAQIAHLAGRKNALLSSQRARSIEEATRQMTDGIGTHHDIQTPKPEGHGPRGAKWRLGKFAKQGLAEHTRMEFLFDFLDGYKGLGPVWEHLFKPFVDAEAQENQLLAETAAEMQRIMAAYTKDERNAWYDRKVFIREAVSTKHDGNFTKAAVLAVALNWGNEYNRDALMQGYEWNRSQVEAILDTLDQRDWQTVQAIWDHIDSFWGRVEALEKELNGIAPEKVERSPFVTRTGQQMAGGYYPVIFDHEKSLRQAKYDEASTVREMFGGNWAQAMTRHGHTIERTSTGGKALKLEISGLTDHLGQVIHDLAFRKPVIDVRRLLNEEALQQAIARAAGPEMYRQLGPWLHAIAGDRQREFSGVVETILGRARQGATTVGLGLKITSGLMQSLGYFNAVNELGPRYAAKGLRAAFKNPLRAFRMVNDDGFIGQRSPMMRDRLKNYDRDVRDFARRQSLLEASESGWFFLIGYADLLTSIPAWLGAYQKAMDGGLEGVEKGNEQAAIDYADKVVRETQAAGAAKDLAQIQRGGEGHRLFTLFYSSLSVLFNQFARAGHRYSMERNLPQLVATLTLIWFLPAVMEQIIRGNGPDDEDDPVEWVKFYARKIAVFPFASVVLLRDLANAIERRFEYGRVDFRGSPIGEVGQTIAEAFYALAVKPLSDDEITRADIKDIINTVGYYAKLPTQQLIKTGEYLLDWLITGEEEPDNIATGLYEAAVTGKRRQ